MPRKPFVSVYSEQRIRDLVASSRANPGTSFSPEAANKMTDIWINQSLIHVGYGEKPPYYVS